MKKTKLEKGITLIALIITIVVLLILAVVTIGAIQESKIIAHAKNASSGYNDEKAKEESAISGYESLIESNLPGEAGGSGSQGGADKVTYTSEGVPVPVGFKVVTGTKDTGLVIENEIEGSQFVWVPVTEDINTTEYVLESVPYSFKEPITLDSKSIPGSVIPNSFDAVKENLEIANCEDADKDGVLELSDFDTELKSIYLEMATSINKYDGFYVGRYETSMNGTNPQSKASTAEETITSATAEEDSANMWYGLYALNKKYNTSSVKSSMMWGIQYDKMMSWMGEAANTRITGYNQNRTCGTAPEDVIKSVYDLYGNSREWTLEAYGISSRVYRGR